MGYWDDYEKIKTLLGKNITWAEFQQGIKHCEEGKNKKVKNNRPLNYAVYIGNKKINFSTRQILKMIYLEQKNGNENNWEDWFDTGATREYIISNVTDFSQHAENTSLLTKTTN
ncbi:MAG: hypothetical protein K6E29_08095, partial [Cyanobacteria bacterium RUI128]|nr:hypothetical protein [Cyanobacteria bacterium RUI128]